MRTRTLIRLALAVLVLAGACQIPGRDASSAVEPEPGAPPADARADRETARTTWQQEGPGSYRYLATGECECDLAGTLEVTVVDGAVDGIRRLDVAGEPRLSPEIGHTVEDLFALVEEGLAQAPAVEVVYHPQLGYPIDLRIIWNARATDGGLELTVTELQPSA